MKWNILIATILITTLGSGSFAQARPHNNHPSKTFVKGKHHRGNLPRGHVHHRTIPRAAVVFPVLTAGVLFRSGAPIILPGYPPLTRHPYLINGKPYERWPSHCSYILGYSQQRMLPPGWAVSYFNSEVEFCRRAYYPTIPTSPNFGPPQVVAPSPQPLSFNQADADNAACRNLALQASTGGPGLDKTVEGGVKGGLLGAAAGAAIGATAGNPGMGAKVGAAAGGVGGAAINNIESQETYKQAYSTCMQGRGYNIP